MAALSPGSPGLRWQSRLIAACVLPVCTAAAAVCTALPPTASSFEALGIGAAIGVVAWLAGAATPGAAAAGTILASVMLLGYHPAAAMGWLRTPLTPLLVFLILTSLATRFRAPLKASLGASGDLHGRSAFQAVANLGAAGLAAAARLAALLVWRLNGSTARPFTRLASIMVAASLAEAAADTLSSELGIALNGSTYLLTRRGPVAVQPGTEGGVSIPGTAAGAAGAALTMLAAIFALHLGPLDGALIWLSAMAGLFFDSLLGATLEENGYLNNDAVNFASTMASALVAAVLPRL